MPRLRIHLGVAPSRRGLSARSCASIVCFKPVPGHREKPPGNSPELNPTTTTFMSNANTVCSLCQHQIPVEALKKHRQEETREIIASPELCRAHQSLIRPPQPLWQTRTPSAAFVSTKSPSRT